MKRIHKIMKYSTQVKIQLSRDKVITLFDSTENLRKWQPGLLKFEHLSGEAGKAGAKSRMVYEARKGELEMVETITKSNLPDEFHSTYEARGVFNQVFNYFMEAEDGTTVWRTENVFRFKGLMALMAPFMRKAFTHNTLLSMERFKVFAESSETKETK
jgi:hypothetical protein